MTPATLWLPQDAPVQGLGLMHLDVAGVGDADREPTALVEAAVQAGVTLLDTAELYGNEELVGRAIAPHRDEVIVCSKFGVYWGPSGPPDDWSIRTDAATVRAACEGILRRLGVETIDLYYLHHRSEDTPIEETVEAMAELCTQGKIRAIGLSNVTEEDIRRAHAVHAVQAVQQEYSLTHRVTEDLLPLLLELGISLVAHSPAGHGALHGAADSPVTRVLEQIATTHAATPGQVALAWVHSRGNHYGQTVIPLPGTTRISHLLANVTAASLDIDVT